MLKDFLTNNEEYSASPDLAAAQTDAAQETAARIRISENTANCNFSAVNAFPLAMTYAPMQTFRELYAPEKALEAGTLFAELDLPFLGKRGNGR